MEHCLLVFSAKPSILKLQTPSALIAFLCACEDLLVEEEKMSRGGTKFVGDSAELTKAFTEMNHQKINQFK